MLKQRCGGRWGSWREEAEKHPQDLEIEPLASHNKGCEPDAVVRVGSHRGFQSTAAAALSKSAVQWCATGFATCVLLWCLVEQIWGRRFFFFFGHTMWQVGS